METGQMNMINMPGGAMLPTLSTAVGTLAGDQDNNAFAGMLRGLSPDIFAQPKVMAQVENEGKLPAVDTNVEDGLPVLSDVKLDALASLMMVTVQNGGNGSVVEEAATTDHSEKDNEQKQPETLMPQEMELSAAGAQIPLTLLTIGRMPESEQKVDLQVDSPLMKVAILTTDDVMEGIRQPIMELLSGTVAEKAVSAPVKVETTGVPADVKPLAVTTSTTTSARRETVVTSAAPQPVPIKVEILPLAPIATQNVSQGNQVTKTEEIPVRIAEFSVPKTPVLQIMEAYSQPAVNISKATTVASIQNEQRPAETVAAVINSVELAVPETQEQGAQKPTSMPPLTVISEQPLMEVPISSVQKTSETGAIVARTVVKTSDGLAVIKEERLQQQAPVDTVLKTSSNVENLLTSAVKAVAPATTSEDSGSGDKSTFDRAMSGQVHQVLQSQIKTENVVPASSTAVPAPSNTTGVSEQVVRQVSEHLANHEIKTGSEQIVLRLSPENLGELKVNLRMENQRLTVEIVTDNRIVRDALLQHSDTLKDSLAKQNIKMDSFDVSTGGNNNGFGGRGQNDWRELARNRQPQQWLASGGYRIPSDVVTPGQQAYLIGTEHLMLDLHF